MTRFLSFRYFNYRDMRTIIVIILNLNQLILVISCLFLLFISSSHFVSLFLYLSVCLSLYLYLCLSVYLYLCLSVYLSVCLSLSLPICLSLSVSVCLFVGLSVSLSVCLFVCLSVYLSVWLSISISACLVLSLFWSQILQRMLKQYLLVGLAFAPSMYNSDNFFPSPPPGCLSISLSVPFCMDSLHILYLLLSFPFALLLTPLRSNSYNNYHLCPRINYS